MPDAPAPRTCFIAMPITTHDEEAERYGDADHWSHVMETLFVKAIERAGMVPIRPVASGSHMIHAEIIKHLEQSHMVLCDSSSLNANVFFELGVRTALNRPIALVSDEHTQLPFDTSGINTHTYRSTLRGWEIEAEVERLADHLTSAEASCNGTNPMWRHFGLTIVAEEPARNGSAADAQLALMFEGMNELRAEVAQLRVRNAPIVTDAGTAFEASGAVDELQLAARDIGVVVGSRSWTIRGAGKNPVIEFTRTGGVRPILTASMTDRVQSALAGYGLTMDSFSSTEDAVTVRLKRFR